MHVTNLVATILAALANGYADSLNFVGAESVKLVADRAGSGPERADDASWRGVRSGVVLRYLLAVIAMLTTPVSFQSSVAPVPKPVRAELRASGFYSRGCPVPLSELRLLTVSYRDFHGRTQTGQLVVNRTAARPLARVFRRLYAIHFPMRHMTLSAIYGPRRDQPADGDVTASFECRQAAASPCVGRVRTGSWSMHAYGLAVDVNPAENPYVGCGQSMDPSLRRYRIRAHHYKGMVGGRVVRAFRSIGWGWGGAWAGSTKDYMHFSSSGH